MYAYQTPGVYFEWRDKSPTRLSNIRTDIAGFVGIAERGPLHVPIKVGSWTQFIGLFGGHIRQGYLAYAVEGFFANGGRNCWVVRVADPDAAKKAYLCLRGDDTKDGDQGPHTLFMYATSEGCWAHRLVVTVVRTGIERFTLLLRNAERGQEVWANLTMAVASVGLRTDQGVPALKLIGTHPKIWEQAQAGRVTVAKVKSREEGRFDLTVSIGTEIEKKWENLSFNIRDKNYVERVINDRDDDSIICTARDLLRVEKPDSVLQEKNREFQIEPRYVSKVINHEVKGSAWIRVEHLVSSVPFPANTPNANAEHLKLGSARLDHGKCGLNTLRPRHLTGESGVPQGASWGLGCLAKIDEVSILAMPDIMSKPVDKRPLEPAPLDCSQLESEPNLTESTPSNECDEFPPAFSSEEIAELQLAMVRQCERLKDRVAVLDPFPEHASREALMAWRLGFDSSYAALYFPWLKVPDPQRYGGLLRPVPPSGHIAGVYAGGDQRVGVHQPPANRVVESAKAVTFAIDDELHAELNEGHINAIRVYSGRGLRVSGARTVSSDIQLRYINVRRLILMIEQSIDAGTQDLVFEPHNSDLWRNIERRVRTFLDGLWRRGALDGSTADEAYSVRCDGETNPPSEQDAGRVICEIGVLPPWPAEFVVVRIGFTQSGAHMIEGSV